MRELAFAIDLIVRIYSFVLIARAIVSWMGVSPYNPVVQFLYRITEPVLAPIRRLLPQTGMIDISPMVALIAIWVIGQVLVALLSG